jgi:hypothetical protein
MQIKTPHLTLAITLALGLSATTWADTRLTYTDSGFGPQERKTVIQIHGDKVRMGEADGDVYTLYDSAKKVLYTVNTKTRQYIETTPDKMRERMAKVVEIQNQIKEDMKKQIAAMPEDQRKVFEERMKQAEEAVKAPPPAVNMEKTERTDKVNDIACTISTVKVEDKAIRDVCIAGADAMDAADHAMLVSMFEYMDSVTAESAKAQGITPPAEGSAAVQKEGLALRIQAVPEGPRSELSAIAKDALNDADFALPADFQAFEPQIAPPPPPPKQEAAPAAGAPAPAAAPDTSAPAAPAPAAPAK